MLTSEMIIDLWQLAGEPSDFDPFMANVNTQQVGDIDPDSDGVAHYLRQLSTAQQLLANWRSGRGRPIRFDKFLTRRNTKVGLTTKTHTAVRTIGDDYVLSITNNPDYLVADYMEGAKASLLYTYALGEIFEEEIEVVYAEQNGLNLDLIFRDALTDPVITYTTLTVTLNFNRFDILRNNTRQVEAAYLALPTNFRNILKVISMKDGVEIYPAASKEALDDYAQTLGDPTKYYVLGDRMYLDAYVEDPYWLTIEYQRLPNAITSVDQVSDIPEQWHEVLILFVEWHSAKLMHENEKSQMILAEINRFIGQLRTDQEENWHRQETGGIGIQKEALS